MKIPLFQKNKQKKYCKVQIRKGCTNCGTCRKCCQEIFRYAMLSHNGKQYIAISTEQLENAHRAEYQCPLALIDIIE